MEASMEKNMSNALDVLNNSAREATGRLANILNVVIGPRPDKEPDAKPCAGGLFSDLECLAFSLQKTQDQLSQLERAIGHGTKGGSVATNDLRCSISNGPQPSRY